MGGGIKGESLAAKSTTVASHHEMLFNEQDLKPRPGKQVGANKPSDAGADHHRVIRFVRFFAKASETSAQLAFTPCAQQFREFNLKNSCYKTTKIDKTNPAVCGWA